MEIERLHETIRCPEFVRQLNLIIHDEGFTVTCSGYDPFLVIKDAMTLFVKTLNRAGAEVFDWDYDNYRYDFFATKPYEAISSLKSLPFSSVFCYSKKDGLVQLKGD